MRITLLLFVLFIPCLTVFSQQPSAPSQTQSILSPILSKLPPPISNDQCDDGVDDNNNGLTDANDYTCYFTSVSPGVCRGSDIVWISSGYGLHWSDTKTGEEQFVGPMTNIIADDISWASDGNLYAADHI